MRATLNFNLPDDDYEFQAALLGQRAMRALSAIDHRCRDVLKHGEPGCEAEHLLLEIRAMIAPELLEVGA